MDINQTIRQQWLDIARWHSQEFNRQQQLLEEVTKNKLEARSHIVRRIAKVFQVSTQYVYMVIRGDRNNQDIYDSYKYMLSQDDKMIGKVKNKVEKQAS